MSSSVKTSNVDAATLRDRKRVSRNAESAVTNTIMFILIKQLGATISFRKTKKTKNTIKMMIPESVVLGGNSIDQNGIASFNTAFMKEVMNEEPMKMEGMNDKQYNRSKEAQINNGLLYFIKSYGYNFSVKLTKKAKLTERFIKVNSINLPSGETIEMGKLTEIGMEFERTVQELFGRDQIIQIDSSKLTHLNFPEIPTIEINQQCSSLAISSDQQSNAESIPLEMNQNIVYMNMDSNSLYSNYVYSINYDGFSYYC